MCESGRDRTLAQCAALQGALEQGPLSAEEGVFSARHAFLTHFTEQDSLACMCSVETSRPLGGCVCFPPSVCVSAPSAPLPPPIGGTYAAVMNALG